MSQKLFNYMLEQHGVTLLETDMQEIERIVAEDLSEKNKDEKAVREAEFLEAFNNAKRYMHQCRGMRFVPVRSIAKKSQLHARLKEYSIDDLRKVILAAFKDTFHIDSKWKWVTTEYVTRPQTIEKYIV